MGWTKGTLTNEKPPQDDIITSSIDLMLNDMKNHDVNPISSFFVEHMNTMAHFSCLSTQRIFIQPCYVHTN